MAPLDETDNLDSDATGELPVEGRRSRYTAHRPDGASRTARFRPYLPEPSHRSFEGLPATVALVALVLVMLEITVDLLPDDPVFWIFTPVRIVILIGLIAGGMSGMPRKRWLTPLDIPIAVLVVTAMFATLIKGAGFSPIRGLLTAVAVYYLAVVVRRADPASWHAWTLLSFVGVSVSSLVALDQFISRTPTGFCRASLDGTRDACSQPGAMVRAIGTFANPNLLSAFLVMLLPFAIAWVLTQRGPARVVGWIVIVSGYLGVLTTLSRGGMLAAAVGAGCFLLLRKPSRTRVRAALIGLGVATLVVVIGTVMGKAVGLRTDVWAASFTAAAQNPLGVGLGRGGAAITATDPSDRVYQHAHNLWLNWLLEAGWLGLFASIAITLMAAWLCLHAARRWSVAAVATGASLGGFAVLSLVDHPANGVRIAMLMWAILGLAATAIEPAERPLPIPGSRAAARRGR